MSPAFKSGFVAIVGRPNAGKSTLVNALVGRKVAIVTPRPQTTRNRIQGIVNREGAQVVLVDTPGVHKPDSALGRLMMAEIRDALDGIDLLAAIVDSGEEPGPGEKYVLEMARRFRGPAVLLLNKVDLIHKALLLPRIETLRLAREFAAIIPISAKTGEGLPDALDAFCAHLPEGPAFFPADQYTDQPERFLAGEIVREKAILATQQEVPYGLAVLVDSFEERPRIIRIAATLYVERLGHKGILIGKGGAKLKKIGTDARKELEQLLGIKVFLELHVKVQLNWRENPAMVRQLGWRVQLDRMSRE